jgi:hypothetical protein
MGLYQNKHNYSRSRRLKVLAYSCSKEALLIQDRFICPLARLIHWKQMVTMMMVIEKRIGRILQARGGSLPYKRDVVMIKNRK